VWQPQVASCTFFLACFLLFVADLIGIFFLFFHFLSTCGSRRSQFSLFLAGVLCLSQFYCQLFSNKSPLFSTFISRRSVETSSCDGVGPCCRKWGKKSSCSYAGRNIKEFDISPWFGRNHVARSSSGWKPLLRRAPSISVQWTPARALYTQTCIDTHDDIQHGFNENNLCMSRPAFISFE